ncbi:MAG: GTPase HflX [Pseudomonadota bacterium]
MDSHDHDLVVSERIKKETERARATKTAVYVPVVTSRRRKAGSHGNPPVATTDRSEEALLEEAVRLAEAIELNVTDRQIVRLSSVQPATLIGKGRVTEIAERVKAENTELIIIDHDLTPIQQRNLERAFGAKVLDRTGLILEIFGRRAQTREGVLQVELAHLTYQRSRLVRSWTHLERQRGGKGFLGGPGETQIEADRRVIQSKITRLTEKLDDVRRTRTLHRTRRQDAPTPVIALVGYTNAGKSTLFNRLCDSSVQAQDMLFATLDPTLRKLTLPNGTNAVLSDTVGFISNLPTPLVAAFRATLEEVIEADVVVHVRDMSHPDTDTQKQDVLRILVELGVLPDTDANNREPDTALIEVWNKTDLMSAERAADLKRQAPRAQPIAVPVSAVTGDGIDNLLQTIEQQLFNSREQAEFTIPAHDGRARAWLFRHGSILDETIQPDGSSKLTVALDRRGMGIARQRFTPKPVRRGPHMSGQALDQVQASDEA